MITKIENDLRVAKLEGERSLSSYMEGFENNIDFLTMAKLAIAALASTGAMGWGFVKGSVNPKDKEGYQLWKQHHVQKIASGEIEIDAEITVWPDDPGEAKILLEWYFEIILGIVGLYFTPHLLKLVFGGKWQGRILALTASFVAGWGIGTVLDKTVITDIGIKVDEWIVKNGMDYVYSQIDYIQDPAIFIKSIRKHVSDSGGPEGIDEFNKVIFLQANNAISSLFYHDESIEDDIRRAEQGLIAAAEDAGMESVNLDPIPVFDPFGSEIKIPDRSLGGGAEGDHDNDGVVNAIDIDYPEWRSQELERIKRRLSRPEIRFGPSFRAAPIEELSLPRNSNGDLTMLDASGNIAHLNEMAGRCILCPIIAGKLGYGPLADPDALKRGEKASIPLNIGIQPHLMEAFNRSASKFLKTIKSLSDSIYFAIEDARVEKGLDPYAPPR